MACFMRGGSAPGLRVGDASELRLCERWSSSAKSVFHVDVQGSVAKSTHAGIPWLKRLRHEAGGFGACDGRARGLDIGGDVMTSGEGESRK